MRRHTVTTRSQLITACRPALLAPGRLTPLVEEISIGRETRKIWEPALWPRLAEYVPFHYALLILGAWRRWGAFGVARHAQAG